MQEKVFSIRDSKGEFFNTPFTQKTVGEAERTFKRLANDPNSNINAFPEDFDLYLVADFNPVTGQIKALDTPQHIIKAIQLKEQKSH